MDETEFNPDDMTNEFQMQLLSKIVDSGLQSLDRMIHLSHLLMESNPVSGVVCEFGCFSGWTAAWMKSLTHKEVIAYDSFEGLSEPGQHDLNRPPFVKGALKAEENKVRDLLTNVTVVKVRFEELIPEQIPLCAFAHVDCDLYNPTRIVLDMLWSNMARGGVILVDDVHHPELPGVSKAVRDFVLNDFQNRRVHRLFGVNGEPSLSAWIQK